MSAFRGRAKVRSGSRLYLSGWCSGSSSRLASRTGLNRCKTVLTFNKIDYRKSGLDLLKRSQNEPLVSQKSNSGKSNGRDRQYTFRLHIRAGGDGQWCLGTPKTEVRPAFFGVTARSWNIGPSVTGWTWLSRVYGGGALLSETRSCPVERRPS